MTAEQKFSQLADSPKWRAALRLEIARRPAGSRLVTAEHEGPLYIQRPFYPEGPDCAHLYILHPPGGIVSGDELSVEVDVGERSACLLTTPGAGRIYRARNKQAEQSQRTRLRVAADASAEWFPLETIAFPGANVVLDTTIDLAAGAHCMAWEITCFGLPANQLPFDHGRFEQNYRITSEDLPVFVDRFVLGDENRELLAAKAGLQGQPVYGFFLAGPFETVDDQTLLDALRSDAQAGGYGEEAGVTRVGQFILGRYLGGSAERARKCFQLWWTRLRPQLIERPACVPRIWFT